MGIFKQHLIISFMLILLVVSNLNGEFFEETILYNPTEDNIEILNEQTFDETVFNSDRVSIVKFYAHWCGHCHRMAPCK